jgi:predicted metal-dependent phosphoesterase TrpH
MLKVELHAHTDLDPEDRVPHSTRELIDRAASLGYDALAITLHDRYVDPADWDGYARERGIVLLSGLEKTIGRHHVLLINFPRACTTVRDINDIARLKADFPGLVVAPHPFFPTHTSIGSLMGRYAGVIDAVEINALYTRRVDFNTRARDWARASGKPLVGNSDVHVLDQLGTTYSLVDAHPEPDAICEAIRAGRVEVRTEPLAAYRAAWLFARMLLTGVMGRLAPRGKGR